MAALRNGAPWRDARHSCLPPVGLLGGRWLGKGKAPLPSPTCRAQAARPCSPAPEACPGCEALGGGSGQLEEIPAG